MQRLESAPLIVLGLILLEFQLVAFSFIGMRMARDRAYAEIAASCARVSVLNDTRYLCAPVASIEGLPQPPVAADQTTLRL